MAAVRRWYLYLSATIGLQGFAWSLIWLLYPIFATQDQPSVTNTAFQLAALVICLPLWLIHWLWGERLARRDPDERASAIRKLYLYANLAAFLLPLINSVSDLISTVFLLVFGYGFADTQSQFWYGLVSALVLGALFAYHSLVARNDAHAAPLTGAGALVRRIYLLFAAGAGLIVWANGANQLLQLVFNPVESGRLGRLFSPAVTGLVIGLAVWSGHWWRAQRLFATAEEDERSSVLRKVYLYLVIVIATLIVVTTATAFISALLRSAFGLPVEGSLSDVLIPIAIPGIIALYHASVLRADAAAIPEGPRQAGVRRLAWYLVAAIGQFAALIGIGGILSLVIRGLSGAEMFSDLREPLAWFLAFLIVGLSIWVGCWRQVQRRAMMAGAVGIAERSSLARRIYLFGFVFVASLTLLPALLYILFRLISIGLGETFGGQLLADLAQALAFSLIAIGVIVTHGLAIRADTQARSRAELSQQAQVRVAVLASRELATPIAEVLRQQFPQLMLAIVDPATGNADLLMSADLIVGTWQPGNEPYQLSRSPARKLLIPLAAENWMWVGIDPVVVRTIPAQIAQAVRQMLAGETLKPYRPVSAGMIVGAVAAVFLVILIVFGLVQVALFAFL